MSFGFLYGTLVQKCLIDFDYLEIAPVQAFFVTEQTDEQFGTTNGLNLKSNVSQFSVA